MSVDVQVSLSLYIYIRTLTQPLSASQESLDFEILSSSLLGYAALRFTPLGYGFRQARLGDQNSTIEASHRGREATQRNRKQGRKEGRKEKKRPTKHRTKNEIILVLCLVSF